MMRACKRSIHRCGLLLLAYGLLLLLAQRASAQVSSAIAGGTAAGMAAASRFVLARPATYAKLANNAREDAARRFSLERQLDLTLAWYRDAIEAHRSYQGNRTSR